MKVMDMLLRGYFPTEMPPAFSAKDFGYVALGLQASVPKGWTKAVQLNLARPGSLRRRLGIPNPFAQLPLIKQCSEEWTTLESHLAKSPISLSRPTPASKGGSRALEFRVPFGDRSSERLSRMWRARFTVRADISDFYGSVYTHSLEWALHTKSAAKANLAAKGPKLLGGRIDDAVRNGQDGQTKGIPVGPDTSLLLAELILCQIDSDMVKLMPQVAGSAIRLVDDIEFYANTRSEAEEFLTAWDGQLHAYDLSLNPRKTEIIEGPFPPEMTWSVHLAQFQLRSGSDSVLARDLRRFFARAFELAREHPNDPVLGYAINRVRWLPMERLGWSAFQYSMMASVTAEPSSLRFVSPILASALIAGRDINKPLISETLNQMCWYHAPFEHGSEVAWSLHILRTLGLYLDSEVAGRIAKMQDNSSLLLLLDFVSRKAISGSLPETSTVLARAEDPLAFRSEDWLLGYEAGRNGWSDPIYYSSQPHWNELLQAKVGFFKAASPFFQKSMAVVPTAVPKPGPVPSHVAGPKPSPKPSSKPSQVAGPKPSPKPSPVPVPKPASVTVPVSGHWNSQAPTGSAGPWSAGGVAAPALVPIVEDEDYSAEPSEFY